MPRSSRVSVADVRALLRLAGELHELPPDRGARVEHALLRLCELLRTPVGSMQEARAFAPRHGAHPTVWSQAVGPPAARELFRRFAHEAHNDSPTVAYLAMNPGRAVLRPEAVPDSLWFRTTMFNEYARPAGIDMGAAGSHLLPRPGSVIGFSFNPAVTDRRPGRRERDLIQIFSDEFGWFFRSISSDSTAARVDALPAHLRRTLVRLIAGDSEKQVAARVGLSRHTVHDYVKALYRRFNVASRAELLIRVLGPGGAPSRARPPSGPGVAG